MPTKPSNLGYTICEAERDPRKGRDKRAPTNVFTRQDISYYWQENESTDETKSPQAKAGVVFGKEVGRRQLPWLGDI